MSEEIEPEEILEFPVVWEIPDDLETRYANNLIVQHTEHEFIISFFQTIPPPIIGTPAEIDAQVKRMGALKSKCVARIVVSSGKMENFVQALQDSVRKYQVKFGETDTAEDNQ